MEVIEDDMDAMMDDLQKINELINTCDQNCTCSFVDEIIREHQVSLIKSMRKKLSQKNSDKEGARCMNYAQSTFCQSELYKTLNQEKEEFTFEADP
jgi:hypothetical protein